MEHSLERCLACINDSARLKECSGCATALYCGEQCQAKHWPEHAAGCKLVGEILQLIGLGSPEPKRKRNFGVPEEKLAVEKGGTKKHKAQEYTYYPVKLIHRLIRKAPGLAANFLLRRLKLVDLIKLMIADDTQKILYFMQHKRVYENGPTLLEQVFDSQEIYNASVRLYRTAKRKKGFVPDNDFARDLFYLALTEHPGRLLLKLVNDHSDAWSPDPSGAPNMAFKLAVTVGKSDLVKALLKDPRVDPAVGNNIAIINAATGGYTDIVRILLETDGVNPGAQQNAALIGAARLGHSDVVRLLLLDDRVDPSARNNKALTETRYIEVVKTLLEDPRTDPLDALDRAVADGNGTIVCVILDSGRADPPDDFAGLMRDAVVSGKTGILYMLMQNPRADPTINANALAEIAYDNGDTATLQMLLADPRVNDALPGDLREVYQKYLLNQY